MADDIFDAKDLPGTNVPGNSPDRFQVIVRLDKGLAEQAVTALATAQGGRIEKLILSEGSPLAGDKHRPDRIHDTRQPAASGDQHSHFHQWKFHLALGHHRYPSPSRDHRLM
jgi:hypothetical protein